MGGTVGPALSRRTAQANDSTFYIGEAVAGSIDSDAVWRVKRVTFTFDDSSATTWAGGSSNFNNIWNNRTDYEYL